MSIPFTQYLLPDGRKRSVEIDMPEDVEEKACTLLEIGCHFDIEILSTDLVSMTCERGDELLSIKVCENGPAVIDGVRKIVEDAAQQITDWAGEEGFRGYRSCAF